MHSFFNIQYITDIDKYESYSSKNSYTVVYIPDLENSTSEEIVYKQMI